LATQPLITPHPKGAEVGVGEDGKKRMASLVVIASSAEFGATCSAAKHTEMTHSITTVCLAQISALQNSDQLRRVKNGGDSSGEGIAIFEPAL